MHFVGPLFPVTAPTLLHFATSPFVFVPTRHERDSPRFSEMSNNVPKESFGNVPNGPHNVPRLQILASWDKSTDVPNGLVTTGGGEKNMNEPKDKFPQNPHHPGQHGGREKPGVTRPEEIFPSSTKKCVNVLEKGLLMSQMVPTTPKRKVL